MNATLQASKWLSIQALLDRDEMRALFQELGEFSIFLTGSVNKKGHSTLSHDDFFTFYEAYLATFNKTPFSAVFTKSADHLCTTSIEEDKELMRVIKPVIQIQHHQIGYSADEKKFRPMVLGQDTISWGLQFAFPQLVQDPESQEIQKSNIYPNAALFKTLQRWIRKNTIPTPFVVEGKTINVPMRLGKQCLSWINTHPHLLAKNIYVN